jgi:hypothetical protein
MTKFTFPGTIAILSTVIATPALAQAAIQEPGAYAFYHPDADLGIGSTRYRPREAAGVVNRAIGTSTSMASVPFSNGGSYAPSGRWVRKRGTERR